MEFANDPIARRIREAAGRGTLSHALLFSGSGDRIAAAQYAAAAMECQGGGQKPCGTCPACRKVFSGLLPCPGGGCWRCMRRCCSALP